MERSQPPANDSRERLRRQYREQLSRYKSANAELADVSWTLADLEQQLGALEAELAEHPNEQLARRIRDLRRWRESLEESVIRHMYRTEEISSELAQLRSALQESSDP